MNEELMCTFYPPINGQPYELNREILQVLDTFYIVLKLLLTLYPTLMYDLQL